MKKRIDPKLPIAPTAGDDPAVQAMKPDRYFDRLVRRLNELFLERDGGGVEILDEGVDLGHADALNFVGDNITASLSDTTGTINVEFTGGSGAPVDAEYVVMALNSTLTNERVLTAGTGITITDGGANSTVTISSTASGQDTITATASEDIAVGQFVAVFNDSGTPKCRVANASLGQGYQADGFCKAAFASGATATIYLPGALNVAGGTGLTAGDVWLGNDGYATNTAPSTDGYISQQIGVAENSTHVAFEPQPDILIGTPQSASGGGLQSEEFTSSGTFTVPDGVTGLWLTLVGAGGGGRGTANSTSSGGGGGGAGELIDGQLIPATSGGSVTVTIGAGGSGGATNTDGGTGGDSSFGSWAAKGGLGGKTTNGGAGGGINGAAGPTTTANPGTPGTAESPTAFGGSSGGAGAGSNATGGAGGGAAGILTGGAGGAGGSSCGGGGGGAASRWGAGGAGGATDTAGSAGVHYGSGGGAGGGNTGTGRTGGAGAPGYCLVAWVGAAP